VEEREIRDSRVEIGEGDPPRFYEVHAWTWSLRLDVRDGGHASMADRLNCPDVGVRRQWASP
jgi:hypothetical protein